jgi:NitT/TauT family transport system substrate-binding protein
MPMPSTRCRFLSTLALAGATGLVRAPPSLAAEGPLETTTVRIAKGPAICSAPLFASEELLRAEGFTDIRYVEVSVPEIIPAIVRGEADFTSHEPAYLIQQIVGGAPVVVIAGVHVGCYELFAQQNIRRVSELKGKRVAADNPLLFSLMVAQVGLDPAKDCDWVTSTDPAVNPLELFAQGKIDAFPAFPPHPPELRARHAGQAADLCATQPERVARRLVDGVAPRYDYALQTLGDGSLRPMARIRSRGHAALLRTSPL